MDIRLLGTLEVDTDDGTPALVPGPKLRAALAVLALRPGAMVTARDLCDRLWGQEPPASARATLRSHIMRLRKVLPPDRIRTTPGGYVLHADAAETDVGRFRSALGRARTLREDGPGEAVAELDAALALWRGTPLSDTGDCPLRSAEQPRLEDLRLSALESRFHALLSLGRHQEILDELAAEARAHHTRERLTEQLMLALYRSGRPAEALAAYRAARQRLVEELGIEPGQTLRELERRILCEDPALLREVSATPPRAGDEPPARPPAEPAARSRAATPVFPAAPSTFVARTGELGRLRAWLSGGVGTSTTVLIDGPGGVGKSALAVKAAWEAAAHHPDGLLYADLRGSDPHNPPLETGEALRLLLAELGVTAKDVPADPASAGALYRERLRGRRVLLLLDNAVDSAQVAPLLPAGPGTAAFITSRTALTGLGDCHHLHLRPLDRPSALALLHRVAGRAAPDDRDEEAPACAELVELCGRLPLALRILATRMAARPHWRMADWVTLLRDEHRRLDEFRLSDTDLWAVLAVSIDQLAGEPDGGRDAAQMFPLLGVAAVRRYTADSASALTGRTPDEAAKALERLTDAQVLTSPRPGSYLLHDLVRTVAVRRAATAVPPGEARARLRELAGYYLDSLHRLEESLAESSPFRFRPASFAPAPPSGPEPGPSGGHGRGRAPGSAQEALSWADEALEDVLLLAAQLGDPAYDDGPAPAGGPPTGHVPQDFALSDFARYATQALESYFLLRLRWREQQQLCRHALAVGQRRGDVFAQAVALAQLGKVAGQSGEPEQGVELLERSVALFRSRGWTCEAVMAMANLVPCLAMTGRLADAVRTAEHALSWTEGRPGWEPGACLIRNNLGRCHLLLGDRAEALRQLSISYAQAGRTPSRALTAGVLAEFHLSAGAYAQARTWAERALRYAEEHSFAPFTMAEYRGSQAAALRGLGLEREASEAEAAGRAAIAAHSSRVDLHLRIEPAVPDRGAAASPAAT
ncbi:BTAD domain-containing putative transcriptional regulator [Streptomyces sp. YIM 98790]|uniref:AfsR/SARP family transcriptional regulator n=1 Tax=Streptomyces sp. YIM 98790 TaxID=2689077 RepID=UPI00140D232C|nr:BTAD domain-containing putative transcriptional regulator [Streptomyces sp. YIM 98790]